MKEKPPLLVLFLANLVGIATKTNRRFQIMYYRMYMDRKRGKIRGSAMVDYLKNQSLLHKMGDNRPLPRYDEFHPIVVGISVPLAFRRKRFKMINSYQIRRNIREGL